MIFELYLYFMKTNSNTKFQLNVSKNVGEKCRILCISSLLSLRGAQFLQILTQIDNTRTLCVFHRKKVIYKMSAQYVKACRRKVRETDWRGEGRTDRSRPGHHHTIIRTVWRRAYKTVILHRIQMVVINIIEIFPLISIKQIFDIINSKWKYIIFYLFSYIMLVFVQKYEFDVRE